VPQPIMSERSKVDQHGCTQNNVTWEAA
jgi:hypothetical protein